MLVETLRNALRRSHAPDETIVVEDPSRDDTEDRLEHYAGATRFTRLPQNNCGPAQPRNAGTVAPTGANNASFGAGDLMA
jgi:glycosyltransferase involved in cell wall biosynthesis